MIGSRIASSSPQKHVVLSMQDVASLIAPTNDPLSKMTEATSADPIRARSTTYSAAAPFWSSQKRARNLTIFTIRSFERWKTVRCIASATTPTRPLGFVSTKHRVIALSWGGLCVIQRPQRKPRRSGAFQLYGRQAIRSRHIRPHPAHSPHRELGRRDVALPNRLGIGQGVTDYVVKIAVQAVISMSPPTLFSVPITSQ